MKCLIQKNAGTDMIRSQAVTDGMTTLKQDGILKVMQGLTELHEIRRVCIR
jgi:type II secretory ATPase GspE/PulE/Tfp pilus assembly ATPase PilB-like protein